MGVSNVAQTTTPVRTATSTTSAQIAAGGAGRTRYIYNDSAGVLIVALGAVAASATNFTYKLAANTGQHVEGFGGPVQGVLDTGTGNAQVTQW